jgi:hypothetical protein
MTGQTINFKTLADDFQNLASHHKQLNSFGLGDITQLSYWTQLRDKEENTQYQAPYYPLLYVVPSKITNELHYKTWEFNTVVGDIVERDLVNQVDTASDTLQILQDVISQFRLSVTENLGNYNQKYYLDDAVICTPFLEKQDDLLNGWNGLLKIKTMTYLDRCSAAYNTFTGTPIQHLEGINFKTFHDDFRMLADHHKQLNSFGFGSVEDFTYWTESRDKADNPNFQAPIYPLLYVVPGEVQQNFGYMNYTFTIIVSDIIERDLANQTDVLSDTNQILDDIISQFRLSVSDSLGNFNNEYYLDESIVCTPFLEKYDDLLGGWTAELPIEIRIPLNRCDAAFDTFIVSPTPTPAITHTPTPSVTSTPVVTSTPTTTPTETTTPTPTNTGTPAVTQTPTNTSTPTNTITQTPTNTPSVTSTSTPTNTPSVTTTNTETPTNTPTNTLTPTATATPGNTPTRTPDVTSSPTATPTNTPTNTQTGTPSITSSPTSTPTNTPTQTNTGTPAITSSPTTTPTNTPTNTQTGTPSITSSSTTTPTNTPTNTQTGTPNVTSSPTSTPTNTPTQTQSGTPSITSTPTNTPTNTQTLTPTNTNTPSVTATRTPTPTGTITYQYGWNLITSPYNPPSSGNTIFTAFSISGTTGLTNPNTFNVNGVYWSDIDRTGANTKSYFSGITGTSFQISFYQNGQTAIYSGTSGAIEYETPAGNGNFNYNPNARPGLLTLVQSASTNFSTSQPVYINWIGNILPTPTPTITQTNTPTNTATPTNTQTPSVTPTFTVTPTKTPTGTPTIPYSFSGALFDSGSSSGACASTTTTSFLWGFNSTFALNTYLWSNSGATAPAPFGYYNYGGSVLQVGTAGLVVGSSTCPTPTPTNTPTLTRTPTPTPTQLSYILNVYTGATAAYSLRKLSTTYTGYAVRVQRKNDGATQNIGFTSSGELDTTALLSFVGSNNARVQIWYDQSGNGRNLDDGGTGVGPYIVSGGTLITQGGKASTYFGGSVDLMSWTGSAFNIATSNTTIALVAKRNSSNTGTIWGNTNYQNNFGTTQVQISSGSIIVGSFGTGFDTFSQATVLRISGGSKAYFNGTQSSTTNTTSLSNVANSTVVLGNRQQNDTPYGGFFSEGIWWALDQTSNRTGIETNQKSYYGTP